MIGLRIATSMLLTAAAIACAQEIPSGTALPIAMNSTLDVKKVESGHPISAVVAQDVPLPSGGKIRAGSRVTGRVLQTGTNSSGGTFVRFRFDQVRANGRDIAIATSLRAVASPHEVQDAQLPKHGPILGESPASWTTTQVGDDVVYRGGGHVMHDAAVVGDPVKDGVLAELLPVAHPGCEAGSGGHRLALWVFSSTACGAYGFGRVYIKHAGNSNPVGEIVLQSNKNLHVGTGSAMLLITTEGSQAHP